MQMNPSRLPILREINHTCLLKATWLAWH